MDVFGGQEALFAMLDSFAQPSFNILNEEKGLENHPDTVDDLFRLCTRYSNILHIVLDALSTYCFEI